MTPLFRELHNKIDALEKEWQAAHELPAGMKLYHFTSPEGMAGILSERALRATFASAMGDTNELRHLIPPEVESGLPQPLTQYQTLADALFRKFLPDPHRDPQAAWRVAGGPFIASFCSGYSVQCIDNLYQWRTFGREGSGYALAFEYCAEGTATDGAFRSPGLRKVFYGKEAAEAWISKVTGLRDDVKACLAQASKSVRNAFARIDDQKALNEEVSTLDEEAHVLWRRLYQIALELSACVKATEFNIEAEWRLILMAPEGKEKMRYRAVGNAVAPFLSVPVVIPGGSCEGGIPQAGRQPHLRMVELVVGTAAQNCSSRQALDFTFGKAEDGVAPAINIENSILTIC